LLTILQVLTISGLVAVVVLVTTTAVVKAVTVVAVEVLHVHHQVVLD
jgi:hypothetical protein